MKTCRVCKKEFYPPRGCNWDVCPYCSNNTDVKMVDPNMRFPPLKTVILATETYEKLIRKSEATSELMAVLEKTFDLAPLRGPDGSLRIQVERVQRIRELIFQVKDDLKK